MRSAPTFISVAWQHVADSITMQNRSMRLIFFVKFMRKVMVLGEEKQPFMKIILFGAGETIRGAGSDRYFDMWEKVVIVCKNV